MNIVQRAIDIGLRFLIREAVWQWWTENMAIERVRDGVMNIQVHPAVYSVCTRAEVIGRFKEYWGAKTNAPHAVAGNESEMMA